MSLVKLITSTPDAEKSMAYIARVSNPKNQDNNDFTNLIRYCIKNEHWSVFEQAYMTLQIETTRGIAAQILRHRSFTFQEFSQRYADSRQLGEIPIPQLRRQDNKNRQNSISDLSIEIINHFNKELLPSGYLGVDIFFVISGYVITSSLSIKKYRNFSEFITNFYEKRIKRGQDFTFITKGDVARVTLISTGSTTHAQGSESKFRNLKFKKFAKIKET